MPKRVEIVRYRHPNGITQQVYVTASTGGAHLGKDRRVIELRTDDGDLVMIKRSDLDAILLRFDIDANALSTATNA